MRPAALIDDPSSYRDPSRHILRARTALELPRRNPVQNRRLDPKDATGTGRGIAGKDAMLTQLKRHRLAFGSLIDQISHRRSPPAITTGIAVGVAGLSGINSFVVMFGFTREVVAGLLLALACCFALGIRVSRSRFGQVARDHAGLVAVAALIFLPTTLSLASTLVGIVSLELLSIDLVQVAALGIAGFVTLGLPSLCTGWIAYRHLSTTNTLPFLVGTSFGITVSLALAPSIGLFIPLLTVAILVALAWLRNLAYGTRSPAEQPFEEGGLCITETIHTVSTAIFIGMAISVTGRVCAQLMPEAAYLIVAGTAILLASAAVGVGLAARLCGRGWNLSHFRLFAAMVSAFAILTPLAAFPWLVDQHLSAVAHVDSVLLLMTIRVATVAAVLAPLGCSSGIILSRSHSSRQGSFVIAFAAGLSLAAWLIPIIGISLLSLTLAFAMVVANLPRLSNWGRFKIISPTWIATAVGAVLLCVLAANADRYKPQSSARLLFDTETFISYQRGVPRQLLPFLDDTRLISTQETASGTVTIWKKNAVALTARVDGIPVGLASTQTHFCPTASGELMKVLFPLVLHEDPESLLLLGDPAHIATNIATAFPLREVACFDSEDFLTVISSNGSASWRQSADERLTRTDIDPRVGLTALNRTFDVVVSDPGAPAILSSTPYFTQEFYTLAKTRLSANGIFCQRWRSADFGPGPLAVVALTMQRVFPEVMVIETGSGEFALFGTASRNGFVRKGLADRLQRPHIRRALATLGWDWCVPLNLRALENGALTELAKSADGVNSVINGCFAYTLPPEMMRWGPKSQETNQAVASRTTRLLERGVPIEDQPEVAKRIAQVTGQRNLMTRYPDQPWAYRKEVRDQLRESPRSVIQKVNAEIRRVMHPEDRRRLDYFEALGKAIGDVNPQTLAMLESYAEPYDPMITYFLRHEIAPLYAELGEEGATRELANRLYAAYYADPKDRSVRNLNGALELLIHQPNVVPDPGERFDYLNGLIEVLLRRWENRGAAEPRSPEIVMVDIDNTLDSTNSAIQAMDELASSAGLDNEEWQHRKDAIERTLTRPLRKYRTTLLPHLRKAQKQTAEATPSN